MGFIRQKLPVYISYVLLLFFFSMGAAESLHHDFSSEANRFISLNNDSKSASLQQHQLSCELCKSIHNHLTNHFDHPGEITLLPSVENGVKLFTNQLQVDSSLIVLSRDSRGPPTA